MKLLPLVSRLVMLGSITAMLAGCPTDEAVIKAGNVQMTSITSSNAYGANMPNNIIAGATSASINEINVDGSDVSGEVQWNNLNIVLAPGTSREDTYSIAKLKIRFDTTNDHTYATTITEKCALNTATSECKQFLSSTSLWRKLQLVSSTDNGNGTMTIVTKSEKPVPQYGSVPTDYTVTFTFNYNGGVVTPPTCRADQVLNNNSCACPSGQVEQAGACVTPVQCRTDQVVVNNACACPSGQTELNGVCQVPVSCRADQVVVNNNCACPSGQSEIGGVCQVPVSCRADQVVVNNACACPSGQTELNGVCQVPVSCRADQVVVNNNCACPSGQSEIGGVCQGPVSCRADQVVVNNACACPSGQSEIGGVCQVPVSCRADQVIVNNNCACPSGQTEVGGVCQVPAVTETYVMTAARFENNFASGNFTTYSGTLIVTGNNVVSSGLIKFTSNVSPAQFTYESNWTATVGGNTVAKSSEVCKKGSGFVNPCPGFVGNWVSEQVDDGDGGFFNYPVTITKSGNTLVIDRLSSGDEHDIFTFTKQ